METPVLKFKRVHPDAVAPTRATDGSAGYDVYSLETGTVAAGGAHTFDTGIAIQVPPGYAVLALSRSGQGFKFRTRLVNCVGLIDPDYRGTVGVGLSVDGPDDFHVTKGDRIAQLLVVPCVMAQFEEVAELDDTVRGQNGYGSTGGVTASATA